MNHSKPRFMRVGGSIRNSPGETAFELWTAELARTELASCNASNRQAAKRMRTLMYHLENVIRRRISHELNEFNENRSVKFVQFVAYLDEYKQNSIWRPLAISMPARIRS